MGGLRLTSLAAMFVIAVPSLYAQQAAARLVTIHGTVVDDAREPVASAELGLNLVGTGALTTRTARDGKFEFTNVPLAAGSITVRRLGYRAQTLTLDLEKVAAGTQLTFALETIATEVDPVTVQSSNGRLSEFYDHKNQNKFGHFFDRSDIDRQNPRVVSELFRTVPGASMSAGQGTGNQLLLRGCRPLVWVNGVRTQNLEVDDVAAPSEVEGIEVYPSWAGTPGQYMDRENRACGTVIIWTRR
jgi:Carboxypeptidase regulatory-like domain/TonB-dependent Receptor Plug Domain